MGRKSIVFNNKEEAWWNALPPQKGSKHIRRAIALYVQETGIGKEAYDSAKDDLELLHIPAGKADNKPKIEVKETPSNEDFDPLKNLMQG